jgi:hypothetical protein
LVFRPIERLAAGSSPPTGRIASPPRFAGLAIVPHR